MGGGSLCIKKKDGTLKPEHTTKISSICGTSPWILDIDEDYLSTQNPYTVQFKQFFGENVFQELLG